MARTHQPPAPIAHSEIPMIALFSLALPILSGLAVEPPLLSGVEMRSASFDDLDRPEEIFAADFDGDGTDEIVAWWLRDEILRVHYTSRDLIVEIEPSVTLGDLVATDADADGAVDIVIVADSGKTLEIFHGNGSGSFGPGETRSLYQSGSCFGCDARAVMGDIDGDGFDDLITFGRAFVEGEFYGLIVTFGDETGLAGPTVFGLPGGRGPGRRPRLVDLDNDGDLDVVFLWNGSLTSIRFEDDALLPVTPIGPHFDDFTGFVEVADLNGDGVLDLVWSPESSVFRAALHTADGDAEIVDVQFPHLIGSIEARSLGDLDGDGKDDLVVTRPSQSGVIGYVVFDLLDGPQVESMTHLYAWNGMLVLPGRFMADGTLALAVCGSEFPAIFPYSTAHAGVPSRPGFGSVDFRGFDLQSVTAVDLDLDGKDEMVGVRYAGQAWKVVYGLHTDGQLREVGTPVPSPGRSAVACDLNGDGLADLAWETAEPVLRVSVGNGQGGFAAVLELGLSGGIPAGYSVDDIVVADLDEDGNDELVVRSSEDPRIFRVELDDTGELSITASASLASGTSAAVTDVDKDGRLDLLMTPARFTSQPPLQMAYGNASGWFDQPLIPLFTGGLSTSVAVADLDLDGYEDVVVSLVDIVDGEPQPSLRVLRGTSFGLAPPAAVPADMPADSMGVADCDGDGALDVVLHNSQGFSPMILFGQREPGPVLLRHLALPPSHLLALADLDGNGASDVVSIALGLSDSHCLALFGGNTNGCPADLAQPFGVLNFFDLAAYLALYNAGDAAADLAAPAGVLNFFDLAAYLDAYNAGCP